MIFHEKSGKKQSFSWHTQESKCLIQKAVRGNKENNNKTLDDISAEKAGHPWCEAIYKKNDNKEYFLLILSKDSSWRQQWSAKRTELVHYVKVAYGQEGREQTSWRSRESSFSCSSSSNIGTKAAVVQRIC